MFGVTAQTVATGTPIGLTPVTGAPMVATGRPFASTFGDIEAVITPETQTGPATASPRRA